MSYVLVSAATFAVCALILSCVLGAAVMLRSGNSGLTLPRPLERRIKPLRPLLQPLRTLWTRPARPTHIDEVAPAGHPRAESSPDHLPDHCTRRAPRPAPPTRHELDTLQGPTPPARPLGASPARPGPALPVPTRSVPAATRCAGSELTRELGSLDRFGPYQLDRLLGRGAMGQVWRAFDTRRQRWVALKLLPDTPGIPGRARERMQREARLAGALSSAHVIPVHDFGRIEGTSFLDMRLVSGGDLAALLRTHPRGLDPQRVARIVTQIADALDAAHAARLVHCDVKPSNVLLETTRSGGEFCYLADFGIATLAHTDQASASAGVTTRAATWAGSSGATICGTPAYMAPELFTGAEAASPAGDVYALGALAHELLTGRPLFPGPDLHALHRQHTDHTPPRLAATDPALGPLDDVLARALAKDPHHRHPSAGALAVALTAAINTALTTHAQPPGIPAPAVPAESTAPSPAPQPPLSAGEPEDLCDDSLEVVFVPLDTTQDHERTPYDSPRAA